MTQLMVQKRKQRDTEPVAADVTDEGQRQRMKETAEDAGQQLADIDDILDEATTVIAEAVAETQPLADVCDCGFPAFACWMNRARS